MSIEVSERVASLLKQMTLEEKIGQMTQLETNSVTPEEVQRYALGSVLSGGGGNPHPNTPILWREMVTGFQEAALSTRLGIPLLYGSDAVHGHNNVRGATIFPHNNALGMAGDEDLVRRVARATALECLAIGVRWNFGPAVSVPQDLRWGRSYEGFSQNTGDVSRYTRAYVEGLRGDAWDSPTSVLPSIKHFIADGAATWGSSQRVVREALELDRTLAISNMGEQFAHLIEEGAWMIDQGVSEISEAELREVHLPPYVAAIEVGALNIMASFSSWDGLKMHAQKYLLTDVLKGELGFKGFVVSDWEAVNQIDPDYYTSVVTSINAGLDMNMVPFDFKGFIDTLKRAVEAGDVSQERVDDAVARILNAKEALGLFDTPRTEPAWLVHIGSSAHRSLAREAVRKSQVLLRNEGVLPLQKDASLLVTGQAANDMGYQCGGWTISWMGSPGAITEGTTILDALKAVATGELHYSANAELESSQKADVGIAIIAEEPYAEGMGDKTSLHLSEAQKELIEKTEKHCDNLLVILLSGRPLVVTDELESWDAFIAAWLPGTEGAGVVDVLFGEHAFNGKLSYNWPKSMEQDEALWAIGYGLTAQEAVNV